MTNRLSSFAHQTRLARASELAQLGAHTRAESVLMPEGVLPKSDQELDLLARIRVQMGDLESARKLWIAAGDEGSKSYLEEIEELQKWKMAIEMRTRLVLRISASILTLALIGLISCLFINVINAVKKTNDPSVEASSISAKSVPTSPQPVRVTETPSISVSQSPDPVPALQGMRELLEMRGATNTFPLCEFKSDKNNYLQSISCNFDSGNTSATGTAFKPIPGSTLLQTQRWMHRCSSECPQQSWRVTP